MSRPLPLLLLFLCALLPRAAQAQPAGAHTFYLALGDSITVGLHSQDGSTYSGDRSCRQRALDATGRGGWVCLYYASLRRQDPTLRLKNMALDGEDSCSFTGGVVCGVSTREVGGEGKPSYNPATTTQMAATLTFIAHHPGQVRVITFELGGNDLLSLLAKVDQAATQEPVVLQRVETNDDAILRRLHAAAPQARLVLFDLYNPISGTFIAHLFPGVNTLFQETATQYGQFMRAEAVRYGGTFVDLQAGFMGHPEYIGDDYVHPTDAGQREIAGLMEKG